MQTTTQWLGSTIANTQGPRLVALCPVLRLVERAPASRFSIDHKDDQRTRRAGLNRHATQEKGFGIASALVGISIGAIGMTMTANLLLSTVKIQKRSALGQDLAAQQTLIHQKFVADNLIEDAKTIDGCSWTEDERDQDDQWVDVTISCGNSAISKKTSATLVKPVDLTPIETTSDPSAPAQ